MKYMTKGTSAELNSRRAQELEQLDTRRELIALQTYDILDKVNGHSGNPGLLTRYLLESHYKPKAYEGALTYIKEHRYPSYYYQAIENAYLKTKIGEVKHRPIIYEGNKPDGVTDGILVKKFPKNSKDSNILKHKNIWLKKNGGAGGGGLGEEACEYIGTNVTNLIMGKNSPKLRLYEDEDGSISLMSKFIPNFTTLRNIRADIRNEKLKKAKGFANFFVANVITGDYDFHSGNVGIRKDENRNNYIARIDNGRAFSYHIKRDFTLGTRSFVAIPQTATDIKNTMLGISNIYSPEMFQGIDFAGDLYQASANISTSRIRKVIRLSIDNLKAAYGEDFLSNEEIKNQFIQRLGIPVGTTLTKEYIEDRIIENTTRLKAELQEMAMSEMTKIFPSHPMQAINSYIVSKRDDDTIDYNNFFKALKIEAPDFDIHKPNHFNEIAINKQNINFLIAAERVKYQNFLNETNSSHTTHESDISSNRTFDSNSNKSRRTRY